MFIFVYVYLYITQYDIAPENSRKAMHVDMKNKSPKTGVYVP